MNRIFQMLVLISFIVMLDQISKGMVADNMQLGELIPVIDGFFNISHVHNTGAAWGMGSGLAGWGRAIFMLGLPTIICGWLFYLIWETRHKTYLLSLGYSFVVAGAVGNLWDRFMLGYVVDFLDFYIGNSHFPSFNVADSAITVGAGLLIIDIIFFEKKRKEQEEISE